MQYPRKLRKGDKVAIVSLSSGMLGEEKPVPELFEKEIIALKDRGVFDVINGVLVGKPQDEAYYEEYKDILIKVIDNGKIPIVYNVNFGHAVPRCALQYGVVAKVDMKQKKIYLDK